MTFLMVFLIQNTQNRDARAINLKLNELIHATDAAGDQMMDIESLSDEELDALHAKYEKIRAECVQRQDLHEHRYRENRKVITRKPCFATRQKEKNCVLKPLRKFHQGSWLSTGSVGPPPCISGLLLPYRVFSKDQRVSHTAIAENKRLGHALALIKAQQDSHFEAKVKTNSEKGQYQKRGRQIYGPDYVPKIPGKAATVPESSSKEA